MALAHSFYAEQPAVLGNLDEARRRRLVVLDFYGASPDGAFEVAARSYSLAKLAIIDGDLEAAERHYRAATEGFGRLDRPVMNSMCLGMVADFDERAGDYPAAIERLEAAIETNESLLGGFTGSLQAHLGWVLLHDGQRARAEAVFEVALDSARRVRHTMVLFQAQAGLAAIHRLHGRHDAAVAAASEALEHLPGGRVPPVPEPGRPDVRPASRGRGVLRGARRHVRRAGRAGTSGDAARGRRPLADRVGRRDPGVPPRRRRPGSRGRMSPPSVLTPDRGVQPQRGHRSAHSWMVRSSPDAAGPKPRRIP